MATAGATEPPAVTIAAASPQHDSLFAQDGSAAASGTMAPADGTTPTVAGFATLNAGTTVSRAETASTSSQNGQTGQEPLPLPAEQLAIAVSRNAGRDGSQNFTIRLSPEKLGSVEVRLQVDSKGKTTANFVVEHAETLGLLKQDSNQLLQSLQNAGIDTNGASLSFSLRDPNTGTAQNQSNGSQGRQTGGGVAGAIDGTGAEDQPTIASNRLYDIKA
jgi:flagellar hook-length control protein FliK